MTASRSLPLTPMQRSFLFELAERGHDGTNVEQIVCELNRSAEPSQLETALHMVHRRHPALRTVFTLARGEQVILPEAPLVFERRKLCGPAELEAFLAEDRARAFDLEASPPVRWTLLEVESSTPVLVWTFLHALLDGRSFAPVLQDVLRAEASEGDETRLPAPPPSPEALYAWHSRREAGASADFWRERMAGFREKPRFPTHLAPIPADPDGGRGHLRRVLSPEISEGAREAARRLEVTMNACIQAAWAIVWSRATMDDDVRFGTARAGRHGTVEEAEKAIGLAMSMVVARIDVGRERSVPDVLRELRQQAIDVRRHEHTPLVEIARAAGSGSAEAPIDTAIVFDRESLDARMARLEPGRPERYELHEQTSFPLTLYAYDDPALRLELGYDRARASDVAAATLLDQVEAVLRGIAESPSARLGELPLSSEAERDRLLSGLAGPERPLSAPSPLRAMLDRLAQDPERIVVRYRDAQLRADELERASRAVAKRLIEAGCRPGDIVGVYRERDLHLVSVLLGIWRAGAAYLPLDPSYPEHRIAFKLEDARLSLVVTQPETSGRLPPCSARLIEMSDPLAEPPPDPGLPGLDRDRSGSNLAYVIYTSGSTGQPKGTMVEDAQVEAFFTAMDEVVEPQPERVWLAVTSLSFDISVLELLYTLSRGIEVVVHDERDDLGTAVETRPVGGGGRPIELGIMFFSGAADDDAAARYDFLLEAAQRAEAAGMTAVWTPERHFHAFGGPYPNPSVLGAALARATDVLSIRAGSVVLPLHHPARVAEEWAVVDNLSRGRVGISFASGWHARDFLLRPENHAERKRHLTEGIEVVRKLWRGERVRFPGPEGDVEIQTLPRPVQEELPVWVTAAGNPATFEEAGRLGANVLTHLLGQTFDEVREKIRRYRTARAEAGHEGPGSVTLMLHTFIGTDREEVKARVREPMKAYLRTAFALVKDNAFDFPAVATRVRAGDDLEAAIHGLSEEELDALHEHAFERYFETSGLFGTTEDARRIVARAAESGADEIACLVDFGVPFEEALAGIDRLADLFSGPAGDGDQPDFSLPAMVERYGVTDLQCTPSRARILTLDASTRAALARLDRLYVGGEALAPDLAGTLTDLVPGQVFNMYGPTETTVWSAVHRVTGDERSVPIGRPIANTVIRVLEEDGRLAPIGSVGEIVIGGAGVTRGYLRRNELTADRFRVDPFADDPRARIYRTGDLGRWRPDGALEFLGRRDHQVKIRGYRIELGEIEAALRTHPEVEEAVVAAWTPDPDAPPRLVAYVVPQAGTALVEDELRGFLRTSLPAYMLPSRFVEMVALPLLPNGKLDRGRLPSPTGAPTADARPERSPAPPNAARAVGAPEPRPAATPPGTGGSQWSSVESEIAEVWRDVLGVDVVERDQNFFDLGGHSLLVVQVHGRLRSRHPDLGITELFRFPTVSSLAQHLAARSLSDAGGVPETRAETRRSALARRRGARRR